MLPLQQKLQCKKSCSDAPLGTHPCGTSTVGAVAVSTGSLWHCIQAPWLSVAATQRRLAVGEGARGSKVEWRELQRQATTQPIRSVPCISRLQRWDAKLLERPAASLRGQASTPGATVSLQKGAGRCPAGLLSRARHASNLYVAVCLQALPVPRTRSPLSCGHTPRRGT